MNRDAAVARFLLPFLLISSPSFSRSESTVGAEESLFLSDIPVIFAATLRQQAVSDVPASVDVITAQDIQERGYRTLKDVMKDLPGFNEIADSNENTMAVRGVMTSTFNKMLIMINGHRMNDLLLGRYDVDAVVGMDAVERIEFIRGPVSTLYGSGALVGAVNILTKKGDAVDGSYAKFRGGGSGTKEAALTKGFSAGFSESKESVMVHFTYLDQKGQAIHQGADLDDPGLGAAAQQGGDVYWNRMPNNWVGLVTMDAKDSALTLRGERIERTTARGSHGSFYNYEKEPATPNWEDNRFFVDYSRDFKWGGTHPQKLTVRPSVHSYNIYDQSFPRYLSHERPPYGDRLGLRSESHQFQLKLTYENQWTDNVRFVAGSDSLWAKFIVGDRVDITTSTLYTIGPKQFTPNGTWPVHGIFVQGEWSPLDDLSFLGGGRYDVFGDVSDPAVPGKHRDFHKLTKRFSAVYRPRRDLSVKAMYGESFLAPMWMQIYSGNLAFYGNPDLEPESSNSVNLILNYEDRRKVSATLDVFSTQVKNLINSASAAFLGTGAARYFNMAEERVQGYELSARYLLTHWIKLNGSYSYLTTDNKHTSSYPLGSSPFGALSPLSQGVLVSVPKETLRLGVRLEPVDRLALLAWARAYGKVAFRSNVNGVQRDEFISSATVLDLSANYAYGPADFQLTATNVLDQDTFVGGTIRRQMPQPGRVIEGKIGYRF
jgi:outer membrane receptor for ferrienterochelin and colicins